MDSEDEMVVRPLRVLEAQEDGKRKSVLVTYSVPKLQMPCDCHACRPFIGIAVFVLDGRSWNVESREDMITQSGGFGHPARDFHLIQLGPRRIGIEMTDSEDAQGETKTLKAIFVAWSGKVVEAVHWFCPR